MRLKLVSSEVELVTPEMARRWLSDNAHNRKINVERVAELCQKMQDGTWREKGAAIEVTDTGHLLNGQHRLTAIVQCGKSIRIRVKTFTKT